jgi:HlyD family secretion protein
VDDTPDPLTGIRIDVEGDVRDDVERKTMSTRAGDQDEELVRIVNQGARGGRGARWGWRLGIVAVIAAAVLLVLGGRAGRPGAEPRLRTAEVRRGDLTVTVSATGNLQPTNEVDVGSEVSGLVEEVFVDDNDHVRLDQILARLDESKLRDEVVHARAALTSAEARVRQAVASVHETHATLERLRRVAELSGNKVPSATELESAEAAAERATADEASARAAVEQAKASLSSAEVTLSKASIRSPINGIVLARSIEPGQTVAASFQAPVLFTLAEDLEHMELEVDVDEADVGQVRAGQPAVFTVDAYPRREFPARITRVGYGSEITDGVVSYTTILTVSNDDLSLRPGMTATAEITTLTRTGVLLVPNAALRFTPPAPSAAGAGAEGEQPRRSLVSNLLPHPPRFASRRVEQTEADDGGERRVWVLRDGHPVPVPVQVGATDGSLTEVSSPGLEPGMQVITESLGAEP